MATLSPVSRRVVELWLDGLKGSQIAAEVNLGVDDVSRIAARGIEKVREFLGKDSPVNGTSSTVFRPMSDS